MISIILQKDTVMRKMRKKKIHIEYSDIKTTHKTIEAMLEIADAVNRTKTLDEFYAAIHQSLGKVLNVDNFLLLYTTNQKIASLFPTTLIKKIAT